MSWSVFNSDQVEYMEELTQIPPEEKCWCGWSRKGQCDNCSRHDDLKNLTLADKLPLRCPECRNSPWRPGEKLTHTVACPRRPIE